MFTNRSGAILDMTGLITKFLGSPDDIHSLDHLTHLHRWTVFTNKRFQVSLDHSDVLDWDGNLHSYPDRFFSVALAQSEQETQVFPDRAAWVLLVGRPSLSTKS